MNEPNKPKQVIFAPGCFDDFDGTQEELDALVKEITEMVDSGEIFDQAKVIDYEEMVLSLTEEEINEMIEDIEDNEGSDARKLQ